GSLTGRASRRSLDAPHRRNSAGVTPTLESRVRLDGRGSELRPSSSTPVLRKWARVGAEVDDNRHEGTGDRRRQESEGWSGRTAAEIVGITYRQLDYWARTDLVRPSLADARGSGTRRRYSYRDL